MHMKPAAAAMESTLRVDKQVFQACDQGATIKLSLEEPMRLAVQSVQQQAEAPVLSCSYVSKEHNIQIDNGACSSSVQWGEEGKTADGRVYYMGKTAGEWGLLIGSCVMMMAGMVAGTLLGRLYFTHGGTHRWLFTWIQSVGWPMNVLPLLLSYYWLSIRPTPLTPKLALVYAAMGFITAIDNLLYSWGISYLPASTNSLLCSSQLAFNVLFAYLLVHQRITAFVLNAVFTLTMGAVLLGIHADDDRPDGTSKREYVVGFVVTLAASALAGLILPLMELIFKKVVRRQSFVVVVEAQTAISLVATLVSMVGMSLRNDYATLNEEATGFTKLGPRLYALTLAGCAVGWQLFTLGFAGIIFLTSSLMSCVLLMATLPLVPVLAVIIFHDNFSALKAIAMLLSMWGFISYIYGGYVHSRAAGTTATTSLPHKSAVAGRELDTHIL